MPAFLLSRISFQIMDAKDADSRRTGPGYSIAPRIRVRPPAERQSGLVDGEISIYTPKSHTYRGQTIFSAP